MINIGPSRPSDPVRDVLYDLLRVIADPAAAKKRLDDLTAAKTEADEALTAANAVVAKAAADKAAADKVLAAAHADAQDRHERIAAIENRLAARETELNSRAENLAAAQRDHAAKSSAKDADLKAREEALAFRERHVEDLHRQVAGDAKAVNELRGQLERKLDAIRNAAA